ncbi:MAG: NADH-quinone oxidoreductase subunit NuoE [Thermoplasmatales archaeon]|nr:MAG: NADH-quinone oxidoreductase subunit NuoE [Thermoplasmatales archaeon]
MIKTKSEIEKIVGPFKDKKGALISILQHVQSKFGYLSEVAISDIANELKLSENEIYGVATFYSQFKFNKPGKHQVKVCLGTACHVRGGHDLMGTVERQLDIKHGEKTKDSQFSLERVACMGCCALAPVMVVDKDIYGKTSSTKVKQILNKYKNDGGK